MTSPDIADKVTGDILANIEALVPFPNQGHRRPDLSSRPLRFTVVHEYVIAYAPDEIPLWIVAVMHGRRSPRIMAAILTSRELARPFRFIDRYWVREIPTLYPWDSAPSMISVRANPCTEEAPG